MLFMARDRRLAYAECVEHQLRQEACPMSERNAKRVNPQAEAGRSRLLSDLCFEFLSPWLSELNSRLDRRLVGTALGVILALLIHRNRPHGLVLSELGGYLLTPQHAVAGTKRISRLLSASGWSAEQVDRFLLAQAQARVTELVAQAETPLVIWDESVWEKPESLALEGLGPVRSAKAARLKRIRPGFFNPPGGRPAFVPGLQWLQILVGGPRGPMSLARLCWWTNRGALARDKRSVEAELLAELNQHWGRQVLHVFDRGFGGAPWLGQLFAGAVRFVVRWPKPYHLLDAAGQARKAWEIARGKRAWDHRPVWDARRRCWRQVGVLALAVRDVQQALPLWLVVARPGAGREPWYLLTNEPIESVEAVWRLVLAYARRWQVEMALRYHKSELAFESPRVFSWAARAKLLGLAALAYAFLLRLLQPALAPLRTWLLAHWCPRNGKRSRLTPAPLYRLRTALSRLWLAQPPPFLIQLNSG